MSENEKIDGLEPEQNKSPAKADKSPKEKKAKSDKPGLFARIGKWLRELKSELKKVQWPTSKQTINNTVIVIVCVIVFGIFLGAFDALTTLVYNALLHLVGKG